MWCARGFLMSRIRYSYFSGRDAHRIAVARMVRYTILRCQCECELRWPECQRQSVWEWQCVVCRLPASFGCPETQCFSSGLSRGSFCFKPLLPSAKHSSNLIEMRGQGGIFSRNSRKYPSIFPPRLWRYVFGKSARILNHKEYDSFAFTSTAGARGGGEILHGVFKIWKRLINIILS